MSTINFYCGGLAAESLKDYASAQAYRCETRLLRGTLDTNVINPILYPTDRILVIDATGKWIVDNAIQVKGSSDAKRQEMVNYWGENYTITLVSGIVSLVVGLGCGVAAFFVPPIWLKVVCTVVAVVTLVFSILSFYRSSEASGEIEAWNVHPAKEVAEKRLQAYQQGLFFAKRCALKEKEVLHPEEIQVLYRASCDAMNRSIFQANGQNDQAQVRFAEQFLHENPLDIEAIDYAFGEHPKLTAYSTQFARYRSDIQNIQGHTEQQRTQVNKEREQLLREAHIKETIQLKPYKDALRAREETCAANKKAALAALSLQDQNNPDHPVVVQANKAYTAAMAAAQKQYTLDTVFITKKVKQERERIEKAHREAIQTLETAKHQNLLPFFERARDIFAGAYAILKGQNPPKPLYHDPLARMREASAPPGGPELLDIDAKS